MRANETWEEALVRQEQAEGVAQKEGIVRFRKQVAAAEERGDGARVGAARWLLSRAIDPVQKGIEAMLEMAKPGAQGGRRHTAVPWCESAGADVAAYLTCKAVIDGWVERVAYRQASLDVMTLLIDELRYRRFRKLAPGLFEYAVSKFSTNHYGHMARSLGGWMKHAVCKECRAAGITETCQHLNCDDLEINERQRLAVGGKLLDIFVETTGLAVIERQVLPRESARGRPKNELYIVPTAETEMMLRKRNQLLSFLHPVAAPMVVPPLPWSPDVRGGYRYALRNKFTFVRAVSKSQQQAVQDAAPLPVYSAVNRLQETAWRINPRVLALVETIQASNREIAGIPAGGKEELPRKPADIEENEEARKKYRADAREVYARNVERAIEAREIADVIDVARKNCEEAAIWFPHNVDFRGRVYPVASYLHPQGRDVAKALLMFAEGKPLGESGVRWLAIHGANCLGKTPEGGKVSTMALDERVDWIERHSERLCKVADDPFADLWWADSEEVDEPLQFYAFCVEWAAYKQHGSSYASSLPIAQDGTCNGLQHLSALLRDSIGGSAVNLVPMARPQDVYLKIANELLDSLGREAASDPLAAKWLSSGLVDRKLCKGPTMTFGYGSKRFGFRKQLHKKLKERADWDAVDEHFTAEDGESGTFDACTYAANLIWESLRDTVVAAFMAMEWFQQCARIISNEGTQVHWRVPITGFPVRQEYEEFKRRQIKTVLAGSIIQPSVYDGTGKVDKRRQVSAVAPNIVHSLDAAALVLATNLAAAEGIDSFAMIHDSYGTHAADCATLARCTRRAFVQLYTREAPTVVADLHQQFLEQASEEARKRIPEPPPMGDLDVAGVMASDYFFS